MRNVERHLLGGPSWKTLSHERDRECLVLPVSLTSVFLPLAGVTEGFYRTSVDMLISRSRDLEISNPLHGLSGACGQPNKYPSVPRDSMVYTWHGSHTGHLSVDSALHRRT